MRKPILLTIVLHFLISNFSFANLANENKLACAPTITTTPLTTTTFCAGSSINVSYTFTDCVLPGNIFSVELSDAVGSFASPVNIGNVLSTSAGTIGAMIPTNTTPGTQYRVRVVSSSPLVFGSDNGVDITILQKPNPNFTINNSTQCINGNSFVFTNSTGGSIANYNWTFGDGTSSTLISPSKVYSTSNNYNVTLKATGTNGCVDSITKNVTINPKPNLSFSAIPDSICPNINFQLNNTSSISSGTIAYQWVFDDGTTASTTNTTKSFATAGNHSIKLIATSNNNCKDSLTKNIFIYNSPTTNFTINTVQQCLNTNLYSFISTSTSNIVSNNWSFGDGTFSTTNNPLKTYLASGNFSVQLLSTNDKGCKDSIIKVVNVVNSPGAGFTHSANGICNSNLTVTFTNISTGIDNSYFWYFGDGTTSTSTSVVKSYSIPGVYTVKLVATNSNGCKDSLIQIITIATKPLANFTISKDTQCAVDNNFIFTNTSTNTSSYVWNFGDGTTSTLTSPNKIYLTAGNYNIKLVASNANGCKDSLTKNITVLPKPIAAFNIIGAIGCTNNLSLDFTNNSTGTNNSYLWSFGDGTTSTNLNPTKTYTTAGTYTIKLVVTNINGCKDSVQQTINFYPKPTANFIVNNLSQCVNSNNFLFTNQSTGATNNFWDFGDGTTSSLINPNKTFSSAGSFNVKLIVTSVNGCKDSITKSITVLDKPVTAYTIVGATGCTNNLTLNFTNNSTGTNNTYLWSFGDGTTSSNVNPTRTYTSAGNYIVKLVATNINGCKDSAQQTVSFYPTPTVNFAINNASQCASNNLFTFTNQSVGAISYLWDFNDGTTSILTNPNKAYTTAGTYNVKLIATNSNGCKDSISKPITVLQKPTAAFSYNGVTNCTSNLTLDFINNSTGTNNTYLWSFGDGSISSSLNPTRTYATAGTYIIKLVVTNINGCKDSSLQSVSFYSNPSANFSINNSSQCAVSNVFTFNNQSSNASSYLWDFNDGTTSILSNPNKAYSTAGTYNVKLIATNTNGCKDSIVKQVTVLAKPTAVFVINGLTGCTNNLTLDFINNSTGTNNNYLWSFGDGSISSTTSPTRTYATAGTYIVKLVVTNINGCKDSMQQTVNFYPNPTANFSVNNTAQCAVNNVFAFTNSSSNATSYFWDFNDGITSILTNPNKAFSNSGTYNVKLIAINANGCKDSITRAITVLEKPVSSFTVSGNSNCSSNLTISTTNNSSGVGNNYFWNFGDGTTSALFNPSKTYSTIGTYIVKLVVTNGNGCKDSSQTSVTFSTKPTVDFTINSSTQCGTNNLFAFTNQSVGANSYFWNFGDGITSTVTNPSKSYTNNGTYTVWLKATNANGCSDSISKVVTVNNGPIASFTLPSITNCVSNTTINFTNTSNNANSYIWYFGDGSSSTLTNPTKTYTTYGNFIVKLVAFNTNGCKDSISISINLSAAPTSNFSVNNTNQCVNNAFVFSNLSTTNSFYLWDFGDGTSSTVTNPTKIYSTAGNYIVSLTVTNAGGCSASITKTITVNATPFASFTFPGNSNCAGSTTISFTNNSLNATNYVWYFGDGSSSTLINPTKTYSTYGNYLVKLIAFNSNGCRDSMITNLNLSVAPSANFTINNSTQCLNNNFVFTNLSSAGNFYLWDFGDGTTSSLTNPSKIYSSNGTYTVTLTVTNSNGCSTTIFKTVTVSTGPIASFSIPGNSNCVSNTTINFTNNSSNANSYIWDFGDGTSSTLANPTKTYTTYGNYTIKLIALSTNGCKDSMSSSLNLALAPTANFSINNSSQCLNSNNFIFTNSSSVGNSYLWDFGDGTNSSLTNPSKSYTTNGTYTVTLTVINSNGCSASISKTVNVNAGLISSFTISGYDNCALNSSLTFNNTSIGTNSSSTYLWNFGDGSTSTLANPTKIYTAAGNYSVSLLVSNGTCTDTYVQNINLQSKSKASFTTNNSSQCLGSNNFVFTNTTTGSNLVYSWNFGDGSSSSAVSPNKSYTSVGDYKVILTVISLNGCTDTTTKIVSVKGVPTISYTINNSVQCLNGNVFTFTNTSPSQSGVTYYWSFGDGLNSTQTTITKTYAFVGNYNVSLVATNGNSCKDSLVKTISVVNKPTPNFTTINSTNCNNNQVSFNNINSNSNYNYTWYFGDGSTSNEVNPTHTYSSAGSYTVKLIAALTNGCSDSISKSIFVASNPVAGFTANTNAGSCSPIYLVNFNNSSSGNIANYLWNFGDGTFSNNINPQKIYAAPGTYNVTLSVTSSTGCTSSYNTNISIIERTSAAFALSSLAQCFNGNQFVFSSVSNVGSNNVSYLWNLGDGTISNSSSITKSYNLPGNYLVSLTLVNHTTGCTNVVSQAVRVFPKLGASLTSSGTICQGNSFVINTTLFGMPPFTLTYNDGVKNTTITNINSNVYGISVSPTSTTTYKITNLQDANCTASAADLSNSQSVVTVQNVSFVQHPQPKTSCIGNSIVLKGKANFTGTGTYQWQKDGIDLVGENADSLVINNATILNNGVYRLGIILPCGIVYSKEATINFVPQPAPPAFTPIVNYCQFANATPLVASGNNLKWYTTATGGLGSSIAPTPNTSTIGIQQYWVTNNNISGCETDRYMVNVSVSATPNIKISVIGNLNVMPGQTVQLKATTDSVATISWYKNGIYVGPSPNGIINLIIQDTGVYYAEAVSINGCSKKSNEIIVGRNAVVGNNNNPGLVLNLFPNPASTIITGYYDNAINESAEVRLIDMFGHVLQTQSVMFNNRRQQFQFNVAYLKADIYAIEVINSKGFSVVRNLFIKAN